MFDDQHDDAVERPAPAETSDAPRQGKGSKGRSRRRGSRRKKRPMAGTTSVTGTSTRHQARVIALQALYEHDLTDHDNVDIEERLKTDDDVPPVVRDYATVVFGGVIRRLEPIDTLIGEAAPAFPVSQLPAIDRNVLRIAIYELMEQRRTVPIRVAINEAIEIAKNYGSENSGRFVHGVLGTVAREFPDEGDSKRHDGEATT